MSFDRTQLCSGTTRACHTRVQIIDLICHAESASSSKSNRCLHVHSALRYFQLPDQSSGQELACFTLLLMLQKHLHSSAPAQESGEPKLLPGKTHACTVTALHKVLRSSMHGAHALAACARCVCTVVFLISVVLRVVHGQCSVALTLQYCDTVTDRPGNIPWAASP